MKLISPEKQAEIFVEVVEYTESKLRQPFPTETVLMDRISKAQLASCEQQAEEIIMAGNEAYAEWQELLGKNIALEKAIECMKDTHKAELRQVKAEIEMLCTEYINSGTAVSGQYKLQIDPQELDGYWKGKGI